MSPLPVCEAAPEPGRGVWGSLGCRRAAHPGRRRTRRRATRAGDRRATAPLRATSTSGPTGVHHPCTVPPVGSRLSSGQWRPGNGSSRFRACRSQFVSHLQQTPRTRASLSRRSHISGETTVGPSSARSSPSTTVTTVHTWLHRGSRARPSVLALSARHARARCLLMRSGLDLNRGDTRIRLDLWG